MTDDGDEADENPVTPDSGGKSNRQGEYRARHKRKAAPDCKAGSYDGNH
ncbi:MAG TPA: hypothetical protein VF779_10840 [Pyrinomonadaceae bacterium]